MEASKYLDANGNRVNVGNFDANGLNVNNWNDDNRNDNIGLASARQSRSIQNKNFHRSKWKFLLPLFGRFEPASQLAADVIKVCLDQDISLAIKGFDIFHQADKNAQRIKLHARFL